MKNIEYGYLNNLVLKARQGSSNAFAELSAAVYKRYYNYLFLMLHDDDEVISRLKDVYVQILKNLPSLTKPELYMSWSCRICYRLCDGSRDNHHMDQMIKTPAGSVPLLQLYRLPITESQVMIMRFRQKISAKVIADIMNTDHNQIRKCIQAAVRHLKKIPGRDLEREDTAYQEDSEEGSEAQEKPRFAVKKPGKHSKPDVIVIQQILDEVFKECDKKPNSIPVEALSAYSVYRKERFGLQRGILIAAMVFFLLLPILFIGPTVKVDAIPVGERGLPVVSIDVAPGLPVGKVVADVDSYSLPVYEAGAFEYSIEPTRNGTITIEVELINKQSVTKEIEMDFVDEHGPELVDSRIEDDKVILTVNDDGMGVNYRKIFAVDSEGNKYFPVSYDEETGEVIFEYPSAE